MYTNGSHRKIFSWKFGGEIQKIALEKQYQHVLRQNSSS